MTNAETLAFNAGVQAALDHARRTATALATRTKRPLAVGFAVEALQAFVDEAGDLMLSIVVETKGTAHVR